MTTAARLALLFTVVLLLTGWTPVRAEDERAPLPTRIFPVSALMTGHTDFPGPQPPTTTPPMVSDGMPPIFSGEWDEPILPFGTVDEVIELVKNAVAPWFWEETEGAYVGAIDNGQLLARAESTVLDSVGLFLANLEYLAGCVVTVDAHAVQLSLEEARTLASGQDGALDPVKVEALLASDAAGPSLSLTGYAGSRVSGYAGNRRAWVSDADVEVAQESQIADPLVSIANLGLIVDLRPNVSPDRQLVVVELQLALTSLAVDRSAPTGEAGTIELPGFDVTTVRTSIKAKAETWHLVDGAGDEGGRSRWRFLLRATPHQEDRGPGGTDLPTPPQRAVGPMGLRYFPIPVLSMAVESNVGWAPIPLPSNFTPPEPPWLPEPCAIHPQESLVDLIRELGGDDWEDPASIEVRNRTIIARNTPPVLKGIDGLLGALRRSAVWTLDTTVEVVEAPRAACGETVRLDSAVVSSLTGARNVVTSGRLVPYVQDYGPWIAQDARILNPVIQQFFEGFECDVRSVPTLDRKSAQVTLRILRAHQQGDLRTHEVAPNAAIELPNVETFELNTELTMPLGRTSVAAAWGSGGRVRLLLVTPMFR